MQIQCLNTQQCNIDMSDYMTSSGTTVILKWRLWIYIKGRGRANI